MKMKATPVVTSWQHMTNDKLNSEATQLTDSDKQVELESNQDTLLTARSGLLDNVDDEFGCDISGECYLCHAPNELEIYHRQLEHSSL